MTTVTEREDSAVSAAALALPTPLVVPRVNLLPPERAEQARVRRIQMALGGGLLATVGVMAVLYVAAASTAADAQEDLQAASARNAAVQARTTEFADVEAVYARAEAAQAMLAEAMGEEVRYSSALDDLARSVPEDVWLKNVTITQTPVPAGIGDVEGGIGTVTFTGTAFEHDDVATWLESLTRKGYAKPALTSSTEALLGQRVTVDFVSSVVLTPAALSGRYTTPAGG